MSRPDFFTSDLSDLLSAKQPEENVLALFQRCAVDVPAYQAFLASQHINAADIKRYEDFQRLPLMPKADYMQHYTLAERCFGGSLHGADRVAVSSGSTGKPTFWPRSADDELDVAVRFEQVFHDSFHARQRSTLAIVCFALGNWVGGLFTTSCCWQLARKGYAMMVATPGNNKAEIFRVVKELAPQFDQTVLLGYPPFVKDVIDAGIAEGIDWAMYKPKLVFAGEVFSEEWRELLSQRIGSNAVCFDSASLYGTADGGVLGNETPYSIAIRRCLAKQPDLARALFGESRLPTLVQYDPCSRFFETHDNTLVVSAESSVPLVRYHIADKGGIISFADMQNFIKQHQLVLDLPEDYQARNLPFVYVFGRADFTVSYYGANIYPENVTVGLEKAELMQCLTGKFVLEVKELSNGDKVLHIAVELLPNVAKDEALIPVIANSICTELLRLNSEFAHYTPQEKQMPVVTLHDFADAEYFPLGVKHRYTRR